MSSAKLFITFLTTALCLSAGERHICSQEPIPPDTLITLQRSDCFFTCPEYDITISADGTVSYLGKANVRVKGKIQTKISPEKVLSLIDMIRKAKFFSLKDTYVSTEDGCRIYDADGSSALTSIVIGGKTKSVSHYEGCHPKHKNALNGLIRLEEYIDDIANTTQWID
jgi:hypothetical protein